MPTHDESRNFAAFAGSAAVQAFFAGNWPWYGVVAILVVFNTVLGEELLFRGLLLPRMNRAFGRADGLVNGLWFALHHLHLPWVIPAVVLDEFWSPGPPSTTAAPGSASSCTARPAW